ncbi:phosphatidate cytidylyltransferase [Hymenobacter properus]|uniref:Phosphatidate cytidylyltransferase n=1 Tax=Hymenobacter properus TaxID=2791026 RepID=A0A931BFT2_9BACT|nr:phosphatidate cytidylyltransferase [Hymenobacter properus]MBF9141497.1 phosphatidate cytidylyltransferase [Hymenobacter properus]MBR7720306.1 phosphatidate cytidylyltransferase [Microvirga sp. SRT04]
MPDSTLPTSPAETPAEKAGPSNLRLRVIYGVLGAALLLGSVWFSPWTFGLFFAAVQAVMLWEFYRMMRAGDLYPATGVGMALGILVFVGTFWFVRLDYGLSGESATALDEFFRVINGLYLRLLWTGLAVLVPVILLLRELLVWPRYKSPFGNAGVVLMGVFYVSVPMALLSLLAQSGEGYDYRRIFALLFLIWASDIGAYAVGRAIGKHKLAPKVSPGKTWEGWAGGFVMTLIVGWAIGFMLPNMPLMHRLVAAGVVAVFAPLGDLAESMLKRSVGVKDSGSIMPGHGGLLDRFDAFLLVLPVLALLQLLAG